MRSFKVCALHYTLSGSSDEDEMGGVYSTQGNVRMDTKFKSKTLSVTDRLGDVGVDE
jgi:hypothetical protein